MNWFIELINSRVVVVVVVLEVLRLRIADAVAAAVAAAVTAAAAAATPTSMSVVVLDRRHRRTPINPRRRTCIGAPKKPLISVSSILRIHLQKGIRTVYFDFF